MTTSNADGWVTGRRVTPGLTPSTDPLALFADAAPWMSDGLCAQTDPERFFPEKGGSTREAKRICGTCPVRTECLRYAVDHHERFGIWGGLSERERRKLLKTREAS